MKDNKVTPSELVAGERTFVSINNTLSRNNTAFADLYSAQKTVSKWRDYVNTQRIYSNRSARKLYEVVNQDLAEQSLGHRGFQRSLSAADKGACFLDNDPLPADSAPKQRHIQTTGEKALLQYFITLGKSKDRNKTIDLGFVESLLRSGTDIACCDNYGQTVLHETARTWHVDVARFLVDNGAPVNATDDFGRTPLHVASALDYPDMLQFLIKHGGDINQRTFGEEQTSLHYAAKHDAVESLKCLVKIGADMTTVDYRGRTPLQLAAELDRSETCKVLVDEGARVGVQDDSGMTAIVMMIHKMPPVAIKALDQFHCKDRANRKQLFYLNFLEPETTDGYAHAQSALRVAVETCRFDVIVHPVLRRLIAVKWESFGKYGAWYLVTYNFACCVLWTALVCTYPSDASEVYLPLGKNWYRLLLAVLCLLTLANWLRGEVREFRRSRRTHREYVRWRESELSRDLRYCHPRWPEEHAYIEREMQELHGRGPSYFVEWWNYFDWLTYAMMFATVVAHVSSVSQQTGRAFQVERAVASVMLIFLWLRFMKYVRAFKVLGPFIVMLEHVAFDALRIGFLVLQFYIPYAAAFWSVFGSQGVPGYSNFRDLCYNLLQIMVVGDFGFEDLDKHDPVMSRLLCGTYIVFSGIVCLNLFIALLSDTFQRVYDNAKANAEMQRAALIISLGNEQSQKKLHAFRQYINIRCAPEVLYYDDDSCENEDLKLLTQQIKENIDLMRKTLEEDIEQRQSRSNATPRATTRESNEANTETSEEIALVRNEMRQSIYQLNKEANDMKSMLSELLAAERLRQQRKQLKRKKRLSVQLSRNNKKTGGQLATTSKPTNL